jgi:hypothetical protein
MIAFWNWIGRHSTKHSLHTNSSLNRSFFVMVATIQAPSHRKRDAVKTGSTASNLLEYLMSYKPRFSSCNSHSKKKHMKHKRSCSS